MIGILSDIHGNLAALRTVLDRAVALGCQRFISLGDVVGYYAQPGECIDLLRSYGVLNIMGNHDHYLVAQIDCPRSRTVAQIMSYQRTIVTPEQAAWLAKSLPQHREDGSLFLHGGPVDPLDQYLYRVGSDVVPADVERLFSGHTHVQVLARFGPKQYCNPGSVGQPRDGDPRAAFAVLADGEISLHRVEYDIDETAAAMRRAGFPEHYAQCLYLGAQIGGRIDRVVIDAQNPA